MFNNMKLVHWPLMGGLLHLVQRGVVFGARAWNFKLLVSGSPSSRSHGAEILEILVDVECMGVWKNHDFRPISRFISKTMQDRPIVTMEGE